ncbi:MAG: Serine/threonine-protein kinase pkn1, partial [Verrucomicrobiota bacterium]
MNRLPSSVRRYVALACALAGFVAGPIFAQAVASDALDAHVHALLEKHCAACHVGKDKLTKDGKNGRDPVLDATTSRLALIQSNHIVAGDPAKSDLFNLVSLPADDADRMPKSPEKPLAPTEVELLRRWIAGDAGAADRPFVAEADVLKAVLADLRSLPAAERKGTRYLTLHNLWNLGAVTEPTANLDRYRAAVSKLLNSLSWQPRIAVPATIDRDQLILRVRLADYGWTAATWHPFSARYPYAFIHADLDPLIAAQLGSTDLAVIRADWFVFAGAQSPFYQEALFGALVPGVVGGDKADAALERYLGIDVRANLALAVTTRNLSKRDELLKRETAKSPVAFPVLRAGFKESGVSDANRLIERHALADGRAYWKSYDFNLARHAAEGDLFLNPLGPRGAGLSETHAFDHDGGEIIFHLPNGLQGYLLTTAAGKFLARAPADIVKDGNRKDGVILNGVSCMQCHDAGMKRPPAARATGRAADEIIPGLRPTLGDFKGEEKQALRNLYADEARLNAALDADAARFVAALRAAGAAGFADEPVGDLYKRFLRDITADALLAELDIEPRLARDQLAGMLAKSDNKLVQTKAAQLGRGFKRAEFVALFEVLAGEFVENPRRKHEDVVLEEFAGLALIAPPPARAATPPRASTAPVTHVATKDNPFINGLGMKFVPVAGTEVLFSVWDVRVQDYEKFATATKREWPKPSFAQGPTHPAVNVSHEDAQAFCAWLTAQERAAGRLTPQQSYRLPQDWEWSVAVGLNEPRAGSPQSKREGVKGVYPWGTQFPPPRGAGNYADDTAKKKNPIWTTIVGYDDGFADTSPVDSFAAKKFGLHDMGGNVWQWCEDFFDGSSGAR